MNPRQRIAWLTRATEVEATGDAPLPTEFRLFKAGVNESTKGPAKLDAKGVAAVLAEFERGGVDLPIDLAHDSLNEDARAARSDADDARGWFRLEARDGELWAVNVTWTPDGEKRLRDRTQRYISPAFVDDEDGRVVEIVNCALCSMPATLEAVPLVATRDREDNGRRLRALAEGGGQMDPKLVREALDALEAGDAAKALEILKGLIATAAGGEAPAADPPPDGGVSESADPPPPPEGEEEEQRRVAQATQGQPDAVTWTAADAEELATLRAERVERDLNERRDLIAGLVQLGAETPATAWEGEPARRQPVQRLADEPLPSLRARVKVLREMRPEVVTRRADTASDALTEGEQRQLAQFKTQEQKDRYIALRAQRKGLSHG